MQPNSFSKLLKENAQKDMHKVFMVPYQIYLVWGVITAVLFLHPLLIIDEVVSLWLIVVSCGFGVVANVVILRHKQVKLQLFRLSRGEIGTLVNVFYLLVFAICLSVVFRNTDAPFYTFPAWYIVIGLIYTNLRTYHNAFYARLCGHVLIWIGLLVFAMMVMDLIGSFYAGVVLPVLSAFLVGGSQIALGVVGFFAR